jgi:hypothetical protein
VYQHRLQSRSMVPKSWSKLKCETTVLLNISLASWADHACAQPSGASRRSSTNSLTADMLTHERQQESKPKRPLWVCHSENAEHLTLPVGAVFVNCVSRDLYELCILVQVL